MGGAKERKRRGAQETHQTDTDQVEDIAISPPFVSRYPKRSSRGVVPQLLSPSSGNPIGIMNHNPGQSRSLKPALRCLKEAGVIPKPELQNCTSQPAEDPKCGNSVDDVKPSPSTGSPSCSGPYSQHQIDLDGRSAKLVSQVEGPQEVPPRSQDLNGNSLPPSGHCLSPSRSFNVTEFARALQDDSDEVESAPDPSYGIVHGHRVKIEIAPLLRDIFQKYGDITVETNVKSPSILSILLEQLCVVYRKLENTKFINVTRHEINEMLLELQFIESQKINARWLLEKLEEISEAKTSVKKYEMFKEEAKTCIQSNREMRKELERHRMHIVMIQKRVSAVEEAMVANEAKANECTKMELDIRARVKALANKPLVDGLL